MNLLCGRFNTKIPFHREMDFGDLLCRAKTKANAERAKKEEINRLELYDKLGPKWEPLTAENFRLVETSML